MHNELNKLFDKMEEIDKGDKTPAEVEPAEVLCQIKIYTKCKGVEENIHNYPMEAVGVVQGRREKRERIVEKLEGREFAGLHLLGKILYLFFSGPVS